MGLIIKIEDGGVSIENDNSDVVNGYPSGSTSLIYSNSKIFSQSDKTSKIEISSVAEIDSISDDRTGGAGPIVVPVTTRLLYDLLKPFFFSELDTGGGGGGGDSVPLAGTTPVIDGAAFAIKSVTVNTSTNHTFETFQANGLIVGSTFKNIGISNLLDGYWTVTNIVSPTVFEADNEVIDVNPGSSTFYTSSSLASAYYLKEEIRTGSVSAPINFKNETSKQSGFNRLSVPDRQTVNKRIVKDRKFNYTASLGDNVMMNAVGGMLTVFLPSVNSNASGQEIDVSKIDASVNVVRIMPFGAQKINNKAFIDLTGEWDSITLKVILADVGLGATNSQWLGKYTAGI